MNNQDDFKASRRATLKAGLAATGLVTLGAAMARRAAADDSSKVPQESVQYQKTPKDGNECDKCVNFAPPNACNIVAGTIDPKGWCLAFAPKAS